MSVVCGFHEDYIQPSVIRSTLNCISYRPTQCHIQDNCSLQQIQCLYTYKYVILPDTSLHISASHDGS